MGCLFSCCFPKKSKSDDQDDSKNIVAEESDVQSARTFDEGRTPSATTIVDNCLSDSLFFSMGNYDQLTKQLKNIVQQYLNTQLPRNQLDPTLNDLQKRFTDYKAFVFQEKRIFGLQLRGQSALSSTARADSRLGLERQGTGDSNSEMMRQGTGEGDLTRLKDKSEGNGNGLSEEGKKQTSNQVVSKSVGNNQLETKIEGDNVHQGEVNSRRSHSEQHQSEFQGEELESNKEGKKEEDIESRIEDKNVNKIEGSGENIKIEDNLRQSKLIPSKISSASSGSVAGLIGTLKQQTHGSQSSNSNIISGNSRFHGYNNTGSFVQQLIDQEIELKGLRVLVFEFSIGEWIHQHHNDTMNLRVSIGNQDRNILMGDSMRFMNVSKESKQFVVALANQESNQSFQFQIDELMDQKVHKKKLFFKSFNSNSSNNIGDKKKGLKNNETSQSAGGAHSFSAIVSIRVQWVFDLKLLFEFWNTETEARLKQVQQIKNYLQVQSQKASREPANSQTIEMSNTLNELNSISAGNSTSFYNNKFYVK